MRITINVELEKDESPLTAWTGMSFEHKHPAGGNPRFFAGEVIQGIHDACTNAIKDLSPLNGNPPRT